MKGLILGLASVITIAGVGSIATAAPVCSGSIVVPKAKITTLNVSGTNISIGSASNVKLTGDANCITTGNSVILKVAGSGSSITAGRANNLTVTGDNNEVTATSSIVKFLGTGNTFTSLRGGIVDCGPIAGNTATLLSGGIAKNCL